VADVEYRFMVTSSTVVSFIFKSYFGIGAGKRTLNRLYVSAKVQRSGEKLQRRAEWRVTLGKKVNVPRNVYDL